MRRPDQKAVLSTTSSILAAVVALALFVASGFAVRRFASFAPSAGTYVFLDFILPGSLLWAAYWAVFHASPYLRPRTLWREFGFLVLSLGLAQISWWVRVAVLGSVYGM
ncbi:MAG: hypothetical protein QOE26_1451 [Verrucomicrobiota bacterium]|jgi:hypothetical protein